MKLSDTDGAGKLCANDSGFPTNRLKVETNCALTTRVRCCVPVNKFFVCWRACQREGTMLSRYYGLDTRSMTVPV